MAARSLKQKTPVGRWSGRQVEESAAGHSTGCCALLSDVQLRVGRDAGVLVSLLIAGRAERACGSSLGVVDVGDPSVSGIEELARRHPRSLDLVGHDRAIGAGVRAAVEEDGRVGQRFVRSDDHVVHVGHDQ
ncbi:hypothetical protein LP418_15455 [Nocardioides sp. B-3]|nr:hypothetical protein [Nocardioides sp. B-3]UUZ57797.1 hypothetical protein LP418_15455 [Nocardioides sp. B-3]